MVRRLAEGRRRRKNAPPSTCSLPDDQYVHVIYGGMIHDTRMLEYHIIWNVRVRSDFMLPRVDGGHTWINYGIYSVLNLLLGSWRKKALRWSVFSFFSSLLNMFFLSTSSILRGTSTPS